MRAIVIFVQVTGIIDEDGLYVMMIILQVRMGELCLVWFCHRCVFITAIFLFHVSTSILMFCVDCTWSMLDADCWYKTKK